jgi:hypothetical protein
MSNLINEKVAAEKIGLSVHWLRRKRWSGGGIPFCKISNGGAVRYRIEDVEAYINSRMVKSTSESSIREAAHA